MNLSRVGMRAGVLCIIAWGAGCKDEFPNAPPLAVSIEAATWYDTVAVSDVDTLQIRLTIAGGGDVTGVQVQWESTDPASLEVTPLQPVRGTKQDSLTLQLQAVITALAPRMVTVTARIDRPGFEPVALVRDIAVMERWTAVSAGTAHTCALAADSSAYCWGAGDDGRLGRGLPFDFPFPMRVIGVGSFKFVSISAGDADSCAVITEGIAFCWGSGTHGTIGNGDPAEVDAFIPVQVAGQTLRSVNVNTVSCGTTDARAAVCWGTNATGQIGFNPNVVPGLATCRDNTSCALLPSPVWVDGATPATYQTISVGRNHTCGLSQTPQTGLAYCWGTGLQGALGRPSTTFSPTPIPVTGGMSFKSLSAGGDHTCAVTLTNTAYCWGANANGQLGNGTTRDTMIPTPVMGGPFTMITAGRQHTCALTPAAEAFCWGLDSSGQLGNASTAPQTRPVLVSGNLKFASIEARAFHTCGIELKEGALYCWGQAARGRLGTGATGGLVDRTTPTRVLEPH